MKVEKKVITIGELVAGYRDSGEDGVVGFGGNLNIRPAYQREFIYKPAQQEAVINSILHDFPLSVMYWADSEDGNFEVLDGQQRTMSICRFVDGAFSVGYKFFSNMCEEERNRFLAYELDVYHCSGNYDEKLEWFEVINIAGEKLTQQELRNAIFSGPWVTDAKRYFSRSNCQAKIIGDSYTKGSPIRQELLELAINWASNGRVKDYMLDHRNLPDASELWIYFQSVVHWAKRIFTVDRPELTKHVNWGKLYNTYKDTPLNSVTLENTIRQLLSDPEITNQKGIYPYILTGDERHLNIRSFPQVIKVRKFTQQNGKCAKCSAETPISNMEADHITPWSQGGTTDESNCQLLCKTCNRTKSNA